MRRFRELSGEEIFTTKITARQSRNQRRKGILHHEGHEEHEVKNFRNINFRNLRGLRVLRGENHWVQINLCFAKGA